MKNIKIKNGYFQINGKPQFIISGEVQYFRLQKKNWERIIKRLKEANCNTLSTYVPWNWHEYKKYSFDFEGFTHPSRDLITFLNLVKENNLYLIIKIGPHIHAEFQNGGIPLWLINEHPEILSLDANGKPTSNYAFYPPITYLHPIYMQNVKLWFENVIKILLKYDNIILWQVDNEISYNISFWGYNKNQVFTGDYNPFLIKNGLYQEFLKEKYKDIKFLNEKYNEKNNDFNSVVPPTTEPKNIYEQNKVLDWIEFREELVVKYIKNLIELMVSNGCTGPFVINDPLLGYVSSWRTIYKKLLSLKYPVIMSYTLYQGTVLEESFSNPVLKNEYTKSTGTPVVANMEIQACDAYFLSHWSQNISDYNRLYNLAIASGSNVINYYWFADGEHFEGYEFFTKELNFNSPVDKEGNIRPHFNLIKSINKRLKNHPEILEFKPVYDLSVGYYHLYGRMSKFNNLNGVENFELINGGGFAGSFLDLLTVCNIKFNLIDLESENYNKAEKKFIVLSYKFLKKEIQENLLKYVINGGHLIIIKNLPTLDENFKKCEIIFDALEIKSSKIIKKPKGVFETEKVIYKNYVIPVYSDIECYEFKNSPEKIDIKLLNSLDVCGFTKKVGKGYISVIGFIPKVFQNISRKFIRDYFNKKSTDKLLYFEKYKKNERLYIVFNLSDENKELKLKNKKITVKPSSIEYIFFNAKQNKITKI